jgi:hypothetical protein
MNYITGASGAIPRNDMKRMDEHAARYYEAIRKRTGNTDIKAISKNTGFAKSWLKKIKNHIFFNEYDLGEEFPERFAPDYDMAVSWQRLIDGKNIHEMDLVMLNHELMEYGLMQQGMSYREAHDITEKTYNYTKYIVELNAKAGIK